MAPDVRVGLLQGVDEAERGSLGVFGHVVPECILNILPGLRSWPLSRYPYLVFYVERSDCVDVWRVLQGQRDIPSWMQNPEDI